MRLDYLAFANYTFCEVLAFGIEYSVRCLGGLPTIAVFSLIRRGVHALLKVGSNSLAAIKCRRLAKSDLCIPSLHIS